MCSFISKQELGISLFVFLMNSNHKLQLNASVNMAKNVLRTSGHQFIK